MISGDSLTSRDITSRDITYTILENLWSKFIDANQMAPYNQMLINYRC